MSAAVNIPLNLTDYRAEPIGSLFRNVTHYYIEPLSLTQERRAQERGLATYARASPEQRREAAASELVRRPFQTVAKSLLSGPKAAGEETAKRAYVGAQLATETNTQREYILGATSEAAWAGATISGAVLAPFVTMPAFMAAPLAQNIGLITTAAYGVDVYGRGVRAVKAGDKAGALAAGLEAATMFGPSLVIGSLRAASAANKPDEFSAQIIGRRSIRPAEKGGGGVELDIIGVTRGNKRSNLFGQTVFVQEGDYTLGLTELIPEKGGPVSFARSFTLQGKTAPGRVVYESISGRIIDVESPQRFSGGARITTADESFKARVARKLLKLLPETEYTRPAMFQEKEISYVQAAKDKLAAAGVELRGRVFEPDYLTKEFGWPKKEAGHVIGYATTKKGQLRDPLTGRPYREIGIRSDIGTIPQEDALGIQITPERVLKHESLHMLRPEADEARILRLGATLPDTITTDVLVPASRVSEGGPLTKVRKFLRGQAATSIDVASAGYATSRPGPVGNEIELSFGGIETSRGGTGKFESVVSVERAPESPSITGGLVYKFKAPPEPPIAAAALAAEQTRPGISSAVSGKIQTLAAGQTFTRAPQMLVSGGHMETMQRPAMIPDLGLMGATTKERGSNPLVQTAVIRTQERRGGQTPRPGGLLMQSSEGQQLRRPLSLQIMERPQESERMTVRALARAQDRAQQQRMMQRTQQRMQGQPGMFIPNIPMIIAPPIPPGSAYARAMSQRRRASMESAARRGRQGMFVSLNPDYLTITAEELITGRKAMAPAATRMSVREYARRSESPAAPYPTALGLRLIARGQGITGGPARRTNRNSRRSSLI